MEKYLNLFPIFFIERMKSVEIFDFIRFLNEINRQVDLSTPKLHRLASC